MVWSASDALKFKGDYMIIAGVMLLGFLIPEVYSAAFKTNVPTMQNLICAVGCGLITAGIIYG